MADWFLIEENGPLAAAANMARDEYLFNLCHQRKAGFFRLYSWATPTFSFGVSQKIARAINVEIVTQHQCSYVRRITGGKTVLHDDEITYAVSSSEDIFYRDHDLYRSYQLISTILVNAFHNLGIDAYLSKGSPGMLSKSSNPCFSFPTPNELEIQGKKIVGSAQKRDKHALLQHGSIPISMNYELYAAGTRSNTDLLKTTMTTLNQVSAKTREQVSQALISSFQEFIRQPLEVFEFDAKDRHVIAEIEKKYNSQQWNYRC